MYEKSVVNEVLALECENCNHPVDECHICGYEFTAGDIIYCDNWTNFHYCNSCNARMGDLQ